MGTLSLRIPQSIHNKLKEVSHDENISINQFISSAVGEKLSAFMTESYIEKRAKKGSESKFLNALKQVPSNKHEVFDKL